MMANSLEQKTCQYFNCR